MIASQQIWFLVISAEVILLLLVQVLSSRWRKRYTKIGTAILLCTAAAYFLHPIGGRLLQTRRIGIEVMDVDLSDEELLQQLGNDKYFNQGLLESDDYHEEHREMVNENLLIPWSFGNILSMNDDNSDDDVSQDQQVTDYDVYTTYAKMFQKEQSDFYVVEEDPFITEYLKMNNNPKIKLVAAHQRDADEEQEDDELVVSPDLENDDFAEEMYKYEDAL